METPREWSLSSRWLSWSCMIKHWVFCVRAIISHRHIMQPGQMLFSISQGRIWSWARSAVRPSPTYSYSTIRLNLWGASTQYAQRVPALKFHENTIRSDFSFCSDPSGKSVSSWGAPEAANCVRAVEENVSISCSWRCSRGGGVTGSWTLLFLVSIIVIIDLQLQ